MRSRCVWVKKTRRYSDDDDIVETVDDWDGPHRAADVARGTRTIDGSGWGRSPSAVGGSALPESARQPRGRCGSGDLGGSLRGGGEPGVTPQGHEDGRGGHLQ